MPGRRNRGSSDRQGIVQALTRPDGEPFDHVAVRDDARVRRAVGLGHRLPRGRVDRLHRLPELVSVFGQDSRETSPGSPRRATLRRMYAAGRAVFST